jgi:hypothetical protein
MATLDPDEICIKGNRYRIVDQSTYPAQDSETGSALDLNLTPAPEGYDFSTPTNADVGGTYQGGSNAGVGGDFGYGGNGGGYGGSGSGGSTSGGQGGYRSINLTLPARERKYEVRLGLNASQIHIRSDQGLTINLNSESNEDIFVEIAEFPFSLSELSGGERITTVYLTTGSTETNVKILAIGSVG